MGHPEKLQHNRRRIYGKHSGVYHRGFEYGRGYYLHR